MARRPKDELPEDLLDAFNEDLDRETSALLGRDISMDPDALEAVLRREEARDDEYEQERREESLRRFNRERSEIRRREEGLSQAKRTRWANSARGILFVDQKHVPPNEVWLWASEKVRNQPNEGNMYELLSKGWVPVEPEEYKEYQALNVHAKKFGLVDEGLIRKGGSVLMKRPKEMHEEEHEFRDETNKKVRQSVKALTQQLGEQYGVNSLGVTINESERTTKWNTRY